MVIDSDGDNALAQMDSLIRVPSTGDIILVHMSCDVESSPSEDGAFPGNTQSRSVSVVSEMVLRCFRATDSSVGYD